LVAGADGRIHGQIVEFYKIQDAIKLNAPPGIPDMPDGALAVTTRQDDALLTATNLGTTQHSKRILHCSQSFLQN
jgi:hypothetical protein